VYVLLNGSFGVGKSRVARELCTLVPTAVVADPEWIGVLLQRAARRHRSDFQNDPLWRRFAVLWARICRRFGKIVVVPMAFTNVRYLDEFRSALTRDGSTVLHFCLTAPLPVIRARLAARGEPLTNPRWAWVHRRAEECCVAHTDVAFAEHVSSETRTAVDIARFLALRIAGGAT
jgi:hypothetical protein